MVNVPGLVAEIVSNFFTGIALFLPQFFAGLLILLVGLLIAGVVKHLVIGLFKIIKFDTFAKDSKLFPSIDVGVWPELFGELLRWTILILFIVATVETWGIKKVGDFLNQLLIYLPNVFIAVVMGLVGVVVGNLVSDVVKHGSKSMGAHATGSLASLARYAIYVFTLLLVLHQLGVAADLIRILFTGVVAMLAIAGGLAFGLGGQDTAKDILLLE
ncbi:MAG: Small-conductance mechanosensitive ion channel-like protein [Parcubacteria group bacterium GW2011_GWC1_38_6]|nr:MAG: Small-conductance mechanosensitive ion channel-like protein [Parcubacteria group bacterium GW2011_GWC1_38_6]